MSDDWRRDGARPAAGGRGPSTGGLELPARGREPSADKLDPPADRLDPPADGREPSAPGVRAILPTATGSEVRTHLRRLLRGRRGVAVAAAVALLADSALALVGPIAIGVITQAVTAQQVGSALVGPVVLLVAAAIVGVGTTWAAAVLLARAVLPAVGAVRSETLAAALSLPLDRLEAGGTGDLVARASGDADQLTEASQEALAGFLGAALTILVTLGGLASLDWRLLLAGLLAVPVQAVTLRWYLRTSRPIYAAGRIAEGRRTAALLTGFSALPTVRALRLGPRRQREVQESSAESMEYEFRATRAATRFFGRLNLAEYIGLAAILLVSFLLVRADVLGIGAATTAALFFANLFTPINTVLGTVDTLQQAGAGLARMVGVTAAAAPRAPGPAPAAPGPAPGHDAPAGRARPLAHEDPPGHGAVPARPVDGALPQADSALRAEHVRFGYGAGPEVLHGIDLDVPPGGRLAIVGTTGSGKSTLATLIAGLRAPRSGRITLGGLPTRPGHAIALVTQEVHLFSGSIADNLRLAAPDATPDDLRAALATIGALDWVDALPHGLDTAVGAGGTPLAAARAQQLALARVLLLDPQVVLLDEATAEAGSDAARSLDRSAAAVLENRTGVVIAHRLGQAAAADEILVLEEGRIVEQGPHQALTEAAGPYATLWQAWSR
ncbi:ABC transporter ATP-binding protein [Pseudonocardia ailaonensis]|uniref:ABC transporter ATP-binding protein n=1 Tax=Pseudonocardia ailaonensis TaxID=367279 RepID=A0ABN2NHJ0_9PSEU